MSLMIEDKNLPRLAWIAEYEFDNRYLIVHHGQDVEVGDDYVVEGVWDGRYKDQDYDVCNHFFGSGLKISHNKLIAVPSTGLVDRIFVGKSEDRYYISNSIIEILARTKSKLDPDHNYKIQTDTIQNGTKSYITNYPILSKSLVSLSQYFYHPIKITNNAIVINERQNSKKFINYEQYISKIKSGLKQISLNASSPHRKKPISLYTTISKGYDSAAVSALTADLPVKKAFTSKLSNSLVFRFFNKNWNDDDGTKIAEKLNLKVDYLDFRESEIDSDELYFLAATTGEPELQLYKLHKQLANNENPSVVFTGYHGDTIWSLSPPTKALTDDIIKPGASGLTLSEVRLKSGFIDVPVPMMHARSIISINQLSTSQEMSEWSIGGDYDRPIPRRTLESRGIGRNEFGMKKRAVATFYDLPKNKVLREEFLHHMNDNYNASIVLIITSRINDRIKYYAKMLIHLLDTSVFRTGKIDRPLNAHLIDTPYYMHTWSLSKLVEKRAKELGL